MLKINPAHALQLCVVIFKGVLVGYIRGRYRGTLRYVWELFGRYLEVLLGHV